MNDAIEFLIQHGPCPDKNGVPTLPSAEILKMLAGCGLLSLLDKPTLDAIADKHRNEGERHQ